MAKVAKAVARSVAGRLPALALGVALPCALAAGAGCSGDHASGNAPTQDAAGTNAGRDASVDAGPLVVSAACTSMLQPPSTIACTGLYADVATKTLSPQVRAYAPAVPLWADGSGKNRWIYLPPGQKIDTTDPSEWTFPVGTRVWKEFMRDGRRIETRFFEKIMTGFWAYGTYQWNEAETTATLAPGGDFPLPDGGTYHIPTIAECTECHRGRSDYLMGFEQVSLGLEGATGLTLGELVEEGRLAPVPPRTHLVVGDDGTGHAAYPLSWLHINCGVSCHNANGNATASGAGMVLRLDPTQLDGRPSNGFPSIVTTEGVAATVMTGTRIVPGDPHGSLLYQLIDERGSIQMPPIASFLVDAPDVATVGAWIQAMPAAPPHDAGSDATSDAAHDAGRDAAHEAGHDAGSRDGSAHDGGSGDAASTTGDAHAREAASGDAAPTDGASRDGGGRDGALVGDAATD